MNTTFTFRTDELIKEQAASIFKKTGLDLSTAINIFLKQTVVKNRFPILIDEEEIKVDPIDTYPDYFFKLFDGDKGFDIEEVKDSTYDGEKIERL